MPMLSYVMTGSTEVSVSRGEAGSGSTLLMVLLLVLAILCLFKVLMQPLQIEAVQ
jgi:hypothetical protein